MLAIADDLLVLEDLGPDENLAQAWPDLGMAVKNLHAATGDEYGWPDYHRFGQVVIPNAAAAGWPSFWAEGRLLAEAERLPPGHDAPS